MPTTKVTHNSSIEELEKWINDSSKSSNKKKVKQIDTNLQRQKETNQANKLAVKKQKKQAIGDKYSRKADPFYGKKGVERKLLIEDYRKQYKQYLKNKETSNNDSFTPEMLENFMNTLRDKGHNPEEIMEQLQSDNYSEDYKNNLIQNILT